MPQKIDDASQRKPAYYAIIPADVRYCKDLEPSAKLLYGEITALSTIEGYCWASNQYFGDLYGVDTRTIRRWLLSLKTHGFIHIESAEDSSHTQRKIYIVNERNRPFTAQPKVDKGGGQKCPGGEDKNVRGGGQKCPPNNTKSNTSKKTTTRPGSSSQNGSGKKVHAEPAAPVVVFSILEDFDLSQKFKEQISSTYPEEQITIAVKALKQLKTPPKSLAAWLTSALKNEYKPKDERSAIEKGLEELQEIYKKTAPKIYLQNVAMLQKGLFLAYDNQAGWEQRSIKSIESGEIEAYMRTAKQSKPA